MISMSRRLTLRSLLAISGSFLFSACSDSTGPVTPPLFSTTYVFGASLEDTGNSCNLSATSCPPPPYAAGRASNGPLWVELVANNVGATVTPSRTGGTNYAHAGARTGIIAGAPASVPSMTEQVELYLTATNANPGPRARALFVVDAATVGNDINVALQQGATNPQAPAQIIGAAVTNISTIINRLYTAGARHIMLLNSTDVGRTPLARGLGAAAAGGATALSTQFNAAIAANIPTLRAAAPGLNIYLVDLGALTNEVFASPATFGFTNLTAPCVSIAVLPPTLCTTPDSYFYWDTFHPTAATGRLVAQRAIATLPTTR